MSAQSKTVEIIVEFNPHNDTWDVGWLFEDYGFVPYFCGYATKEEAEAEIPGFDERVKQETAAYRAEKEAEEREENKRWPNIGYVRDRIAKLRNSGKAKDFVKALEASGKLNAMLDRDRHEHISWPLPSWRAISPDYDDGVL